MMEWNSSLRRIPRPLSADSLESVERWRRQAISRKLALPAAPGCTGSVHLYPLRRLLSHGPPSGEWTWEHKGALRSAVTNRQWTQHRLHQANRVDTVACQLCVATGRCSPSSTDPAFRGTLLHRVCTCPSLADFRARYMPVSVRLAVEAATRADGSIDPEATVWLTRAMATAPFGMGPGTREE